MHVHQEAMSIWCSKGLRNQGPVLLVIYHSGCYLFFLLFQSLFLPLSRFQSTHRRYPGPLNQVTSHSCLCPWEDRVLSTVRTHCSTSEEEEMKRLDVALTALPRPLNRRRDKGERVGWRKTEKCEWENVCQNPAGWLSLSVTSGQSSKCVFNIVVDTSSVLSGRSPDDTSWSQLCCFKNISLFFSTSLLSLKWIINDFFLDKQH